MIKQIVEIDGKYYLRSYDLMLGWEYADSDDLYRGHYIYWWSKRYLEHCSFESLEILQESIEGYNMKRKKLKEQQKSLERANSVKIIKTYWFKWL